MFPEGTAQSVESTFLRRIDISIEAGANLFKSADMDSPGAAQEPPVPPSGQNTGLSPRLSVPRGLRCCRRRARGRRIVRVPDPSRAVEGVRVPRREGEVVAETVREVGVRDKRFAEGDGIGFASPSAARISRTSRQTS